MKKSLFVLALFATLCVGIFAQDAAPTGNQPQLVQAAFYTPTYQCFYMKGSDKLGMKDPPGIRG